MENISILFEYYKPNIDKIINHGSVVNVDFLLHFLTGKYSQYFSGGHYDSDNDYGNGISEGTKTIWFCAFKDCVSLTNLRIPSSLKLIKNNAFYRCYNLSDINCGDNVNFKYEGMIGNGGDINPYLHFSYFKTKLNDMFDIVLKTKKKRKRIGK